MENALHDLYLQLNYVCYEEGMSNKLASVWNAFYKLEVAFKNSHQHTQPAKCLGCEYWRGHCGNCCMRGDSEESCIKFGTQQAGA